MLGHNFDPFADQSRSMFLPSIGQDEWCFTFGVPMEINLTWSETENKVPGAFLPNFCNKVNENIENDNYQCPEYRALDNIDNV